MAEASFIDALLIFEWKWIFLITFMFVLRYYFKGAQFKERVSAKNLIAVVTGCNCGIGKQIVRELNLRGAKVYMLCRNENRASKAVIELVKLGCNAERLIVEIVDLSKFATIRAAAAKIEKEVDHIDVLINNAGVMMYPKFKLTDDGHEYVWQTNYLGHFLLTELLLPLLQAAPSSRIINVSALAHRYADTLDLQTIDDREKWDSRQSYSKSKLAMVMHGSHLTKQLRALEASNVTINSCHPGLCHTNLMRHTPLNKNPLNFITAPFRWFLLKTPKDGAQTPLYLALSKHVAGVSGMYFSECSPKEPLSLDDWSKKCEELYEYSLSACKLNDVVVELK